MKTVKVSIQDENTLVLQEDAAKGDLIDLKSLHDLEIDKTSITAVVNSIKLDKFNEALQEKTESIKRESALELQIKEKEILAEKNQEINELTSKLQSNDTKTELEVTKAVSLVEKERDQLQFQLKNKETEKESELLRLNDKFQNELKTKDEMIAYYKDMKAKLSTKMLGETLELHCEILFNKIRATAFPRATFGKDNDASSGSKGDYIYREVDENGNEIISIMFEMKNEGDETATKKKNEDFLKELDKDRSEKGCEYAILVSLLEADNEQYNDGIADVSYLHAKMYVIRPQFFIPIISLLRNAALNSLKYKAELALVRSQNIDVTTFEDDMTNWKTGFLTSMQYAGKQHLEAIEQISKAIKDLEKVRDALTLSDKHLLAAENKMDDLTIKKLTHKNLTMAAKFAEAKK